MPFDWKKLDLFNKAEDPDVMQVKTSAGAVVSIASVLFMLLLTFTEMGLYLRTEQMTHLMVDVEAGHTLFDASFSISFYRVKCDALNLVLQDSKGREMPDAKVLSTDKQPWTPPDQDPTDDPHGCTMHAKMVIPRVAGKFFFTSKDAEHDLHTAGSPMGLHSAVKALNFNSSHFIHALSFGPVLPVMSSHSLVAVTKAHGSGLMAYDYYLKLVPTEYQPVSSVPIRTHQYASTEYEQAAGLQGHHLVRPGTVFHYDFTPILITYQETRRTFLQFLTSLCAIVGGVFTVSGMVNSTLFASSRLMNKLK